MLNSSENSLNSLSDLDCTPIENCPCPDVSADKPAPAVEVTSSQMLAKNIEDKPKPVKKDNPYKKSKNKPVQCPYCASILKGGLNRHIQSVHINNRPFKCEADGCFQSFNRNDYLLEHMRSKHGAVYQPMVLNCPLADQGCIKTFPSRQLLKYHIEVNHKYDVLNDSAIEFITIENAIIENKMIEK